MNRRLQMDVPLRMASRVLVLGAAALLAIGCSREDSSSPTDTAAEANDGTTAQESTLQLVVFGPAPQQTDPFVIETAAIAADTLDIRVSYGGGCKDHAFVLSAAEAFMESDPMQLALDLTHDANDDACEAWLTKDLRFDLTDIRKRYETSYQLESGVVILRLPGAPDGSLEYRF